jgi:hypothetical protein
MNPRTRRAALYAIGLIALLATANARPTWNPPSEPSCALPPATWPGPGHHGATSPASGTS